MGQGGPDPSARLAMASDQHPISKIFGSRLISASESRSTTSLREPLRRPVNRPKLLTASGNALWPLLGHSPLLRLTSCGSSAYITWIRTSVFPVAEVVAPQAHHRKHTTFVPPTCTRLLFLLVHCAGGQQASCSRHPHPMVLQQLPTWKLCGRIKMALKGDGNNCEFQKV
jgi:hypothetical protein